MVVCVRVCVCGGGGGQVVLLKWHSFKPVALEANFALLVGIVVLALE